MDIIGNCIKDFYENNLPENIITHINLSEEPDEIPAKYLFRNFKEMPEIEQKALQMCQGNILDIGAGSGSHSLYLQQKGKKITALDISKGAIEICKKRGIDTVICTDINFYSPTEKYDTILLLMNGSGIAGKLNKLGEFLKNISNLLNEGGQILMDSSDIIYMYEDENNEFWVDASQNYYGEVSYQMEYKKQTTSPFPWLFVDYNTLQRCANFNNLNCELIIEGPHYDYLARITKI